MYWRDTLKQVLRKAGYDITRFPLPGYLRQFGIDVVLDVGANEGGYAEMLRQFGYQGRIISFEPLQDVFEGLQRRVAGDALWEARNVALGAERRTGTINVSGAHASSSILGIGSRSTEIVPETRYVGTQPIDIVPSDDLFPQLVSGSDRVFLKIDTQGYEREVLEGSTRALDGILGIQIEMSLVELYDGETLMPEMMNLLMARGFSPMWLEPGFKDPKTLQLLQVDGFFFRTDRT